MMLLTEVFDVAQVRKLETAEIAAGTPGYTLMQRAGAAALAFLRQRWPRAARVVVVVGPGNNGGDGLVLARLAQEAGLTVSATLVGEVGRLRGEAAAAYTDLRATGMNVLPFDPTVLSQADVIVDALLGIGVRLPLGDECLHAIAAINASGRPVLALDIPSGLDPDTGAASQAVRATATLSFVALKQGHFLGDGPDYCGELHCDALQVSSRGMRAAFHRLDDTALSNALQPRPRQSHKAQFGRVLIVGGGAGMPGAVRLAGEAALRVGAGLVTVASLPDHLLPVVGMRPELMFHALQDVADVDVAVGRADVVAIGPGLGHSGWAREILVRVLAARRAGQPLVVDADALNLIADGAGIEKCQDWVLTPHPGEAARLLGITAAEVQRDRPAALKALCARRGGTVVLKGATTLVGHALEIPRLCDRGNAGMAVPGMGDVLTGAVAGFLAQGATPFAAASAAVFAHATAGDRCARAGIRGVMAQDVATELRSVLTALP